MLFIKFNNNLYLIFIVDYRQICKIIRSMLVKIIVNEIKSIKMYSIKRGMNFFL